jgi:hypothetical protein
MNTSKQHVVRKGSIWMILLLLTAGGALTSCRDSAIKDLSPADSPVYITNYDNSVNFGQYKTFSLPDSVVVQSNDNYQTVRSAIADQFVSNVAAALTAKGYQRVAVIRVNNQYTGVASNPYSSYYSNYWGGGYGGLGGYGYSPYYQSYYTYQVTDQYWEIQMVDLKNAPVPTSTAQPKLNVIYDATVRGTDVPDTQAVSAATNAIFSQSPYLKAAQ